MALLGLQHVHFQNIPKATVRWGAATPEITRWTPCTGKPARIQRVSLAKSFTDQCFLRNKWLAWTEVPTVDRIGFSFIQIGKIFVFWRSGDFSKFFLCDLWDSYQWIGTLIIIGANNVFLEANLKCWRTFVKVSTSKGKIKLLIFFENRRTSLNDALLKTREHLHRGINWMT